MKKSLLLVACSLAALVGCSTTIVGGPSSGSLDDSNSGSGTNLGGGEGGGTTTDPDLAALFDPPPSGTGRTPDSVTGTWAGTVSSEDVRVRFADGELLIAVRVSRSGQQEVVGLRTAAEITSSSILLTASASTRASNGYELTVRPAEFNFCTDAEYSSCVVLEGTKLDFSRASTPLFEFGYSGPSELLKVSD